MHKPDITKRMSVATQVLKRCKIISMFEPDVNCRSFVYHHFGLIPTELAFDNLTMQKLLVDFVEVSNIFAAQALAAIQPTSSAKIKSYSLVKHMALVDRGKRTITHRKGHTRPITRNEKIAPGLADYTWHQQHKIIYLVPR